MALTTNLGLDKPTVGGDTDTWGTKLNTVIDGLDAVFKADGTGTSVGVNVGSGKTLAVAGTLSGAGVSTYLGTYLAAPAAIGGTTPAAGAFSTLGVGTTAPTTPFELISTATGTARFVSTDAGTVNQTITFYRNSASPAVSDGVTILQFAGNNSSSAEISYARLRTTINSPTAGAHTGNFFIEVPNAAVTKTVLQTDGVSTLIGDSTIQIDGTNVTAGIGRTPGTTTRLRVNGLGTTNSTSAVIIADSASVVTFEVEDDGLIRTGSSAGAKAGAPYNNAAGSSTPKVLFVNSAGGVQSQDAYNTTTATAANAVAQTNGTIARSTSSLKYKRDVENFTPGLTETLALRPVTYRGKNPTDGEKVWGGLIAEEVAAIPGLMPFVMQAEDGSPDALAYGNMVALLVNAIKEQQGVIAALEARVAALEAE